MSCQRSAIKSIKFSSALSQQCFELPDKSKQIGADCFRSEISTFEYFLLAQFDQLLIQLESAFRRFLLSFQVPSWEVRVDRKPCRACCGESGVLRVVPLHWCSHRITCEFLVDSFVGLTGLRIISFLPGDCAVVGHQNFFALTILII